MARRVDRTDLQLEREKCFLIAAILPGRYSDFEDPLSELACLVDTADGDVVGSITQKMDRPHRRTYLGKGKFADMVEAVKESGADTIVVDDDLSPTQLSTMEEACQKKVIDRSEVILDIFGSRARSHQAKLQVELAQMQYELPRLARKWTHLERLGGGIGTRGPGESQIESDRRILRGRIARLQKELDNIEARKIREVQSRKTSFTACLVGYTNAGKSTLLNTLTGSKAYVKNALFATLDTLTRKMEFDSGDSLLISDTVGFIRRLPHHLIASFHATLEEAAQSDLLLHVIDASDPMSTLQLDSVEQTLTELGMSDTNRLYVLNKADSVEDRSSLEALASRLEPSIIVSASSGEGIEELKELLLKYAKLGKREWKVRFPAGDGKRISMLNTLGNVMETEYEDSDVVIKAVLSVEDYERIRKLPGEIEEVS